MPMKTNRRGFLAGALVGGAGAALTGCAAPPAAAAAAPPSSNPNYAKLDEVLKQPVLKRRAVLDAGHHRDARIAPPG